MSSTNVVRDTTGSDYLNNLRLTNQQIQAGNTAQTNFTPLYIIQEGDTIDITDAVSNNSNVQTQSDTIDITDSVSEVDYPAGASSLAGNAFKKLWLQFNNDVLDNSTNGNDGTITYNSNLKGLWFYNAQGNVLDATGNGNGTVTGTTKYARGHEGTAFSFDGATSVGTSISPYNWERTQAFSVSFWAKVSSTSGTETIIGNGTSGTLQGWQVNFESGNVFSLILCNTYNTNLLYVYANNVVVTDNAWHHYVMTYDGSSTPTGTKFYVDGVLKTTTTLNNTLSATTISTKVVTIGMSDGGTAYFTGLLNQVRVYTIQLSANQVSALFMSGVIGSCHTFDGGEYVSVGNPSNLQFERTDSFSISFWAKVPSNTNFQPFITKWSGTAGYGVDMNGSGQMQFFLINGVSNRIILYTTSNIFDNNWHHIVWTYDGSSSASGVKLYIDSVLTSTVTGANSLSASILNSNNVDIGHETGDVTLLTGQIDDLQVWKTYVLSQTEINYLFAKKDGWQVEEDADFQPLYLPMDNDVLDKSGNQNNGTITGTETYVAGPKTKNAFSFNGSTYILCGSSTNFNFNKSQPFSIALWVKTTNASSQYLMEKTDNSELNGWIIYNPSPSDLRFYIMGTNSSTDALTVKTTTKINDGYWHHIVVTYDGSGSTAGMFIYVDGSHANNSSLVNTLTTSVITNSNTLHVGSRIDGLIEWVGQMSDVEIWNYVLSQADINTLLGGQQIKHNPVVPTPLISDFMEAVA